MFRTVDNEDEKIYKIREYDIFQHIKLLEEHVEDFIKNDHRNLILDLEDLDVIDSLFLSVIVKFRTKLSIGGRELSIINYNENIYRCFKLLHLDGHLLGSRTEP